MPPSSTILRQLLKGLMHRLNLGKKKKKGKEKQMDFLFVTADQAISILPSSQVFVTRVIKKKGKEGSDSEVRVLPLEKKKKKTPPGLVLSQFRNNIPQASYSSALCHCISCFPLGVTSLVRNFHSFPAEDTDVRGSLIPTLQSVS